MEKEITIKRKIKRKLKYKCKTCGRLFDKTTNYKSHLLVCEQLSNTTKYNLMLSEEEDNIPSTKQLYYLIRNLIVKNDSLQQEIEKLKTFANISKKNINAVDWLNENMKDVIDFSIWTKEIQFTRENLKTVFKYGYIEGIYQFIESKLPTLDTQSHPIKCFDQKKNIFFIHIDKWKHMKIDDLNVFISNISGKVISEFYKWKTENSEKIDSDDTAYDEYIKYMRIVLGEHKTNEQIIRALTPKLYNYLKCDLKNIVKYEFVF